MHTHEEYLKKIEHFLSDLLISERLDLLNKIQDEIKEKSDLELQDALVYTNIKRGELGFSPYVDKKPFSFFKLFMKLTAAMSVITIIFISVLLYKFTPLLKVDEENNRVIILGGLIDIDGKAGKFKIGDDYHFTKDTFSNDLQASINLDEDKDEVIVKFLSGSFELKNAEDGEFKLDCKLEKPADQNVIEHQVDFIKIDLTTSGGSNCTLAIPEDKKISLEGQVSSVTVLNPIFNLYVDLESGKVAITPEEEIDYLYRLEVKSGYIGEFETSEAENAYEIQINIESGSVIRK